MILARTIAAALQTFESRVANPALIKRAARGIDAALERGVEIDVVRKIQAQRLRETMGYVAEYSPFYRQMFRRTGISPKEIDDPSDLGNLPFTTSDDIREVQKFLCVPDEALAAVFTTAGSTGRPKRIYYTLKDLQQITNFSALALRAQYRGPLHALIALPMRHGLWIGSATAESIIRRAGGLPLPVGAGDPQETLEWMRRFEPNVIISAPSYLTVLTQTAGNAGYDRKLDMIMLGGEMLTEEQQSRFEAYWGAQVSDGYGMTEISGAQTLSLPDCDGFHINDFHLVTEIVDPETGEAAEEGELVFTTIRREAMPLLRYRSGDRARWLECPDRIPLPAIQLLGRLDDMIVAGDANLHGSVIADAVTEILGSERRIRIRVDKVDMIDRLTLEMEGKEVSKEEVCHALYSVYPEARTSVENGHLKVEVTTGADLSDQIKALKMVDERESGASSA
ncbi:MAG: phenylacetate--CoA ligase family protein [Chloroflexota bacterium]